MTVTDWDDAYQNSGYIERAEQYPVDWARDAESYRQSVENAEYDIAYGAHQRQKYDLFQPDGDGLGLMVFVHGGYWMKLDKSSWSHLAAGAVAQGWAVAVPSYVLTPEAWISDITRQIGAAVNHAGRRVAGPIRLAGHSAGGHLVSRMICDSGPLQAEIVGRIEHVLSISGLHDLRPLLRTEMNQTLRLDAGEAARESAALATPVPGTRLTTWVGSDERPEFLRQSRLMVQAWPGTVCVEDVGHHHFSVISDLVVPGSVIVKTLLG